FTKQTGSLPVQDDFVAMMPGGKVYATEAGCFAKTFALSEEDEPTIYGAVTRSEAYLENVSQDDDGNLDFFDTSYTQNGRATFSFSTIDAADARELQSADFLLILNRNENIIPAVAVKATAEGTIEWTDDPDFGYQVAAAVPGMEESDSAVLRPRELYEQQGRMDEYDKIVATLKEERVEYLKKYPALSDEIVDA